MPFWRRDEPVHERLAREGGLVPERGGRDGRQRWFEDLVGIHGVPRPREWDAVATVRAPELAAERIEFVVLSDGMVLIEEGPEGDIAPLADALEQTLSPPFRAEAVPQGDGAWAVAANRVEVLELPELEGGEEVMLTVRDDERKVVIDGAETEGTIAALEAHAGAQHASFVAHATRLDGDLWEVRVYAL